MNRVQSALRQAPNEYEARARFDGPSRNRFGPHWQTARGLPMGDAVAKPEAVARPTGRADRLWPTV